MTLTSTRNVDRRVLQAESSSRSSGVVELSAAPGGTVAAADSIWHVLHTRSRQEKALARAFEAADIRYELPLVRQMRFYGHRKREVAEPLFSNYIFVQGTPEVTYFAMATRRVANVIAIPDQVGFVRDLTQIRLALTGGAELNPYCFLTVGRRVRVIAGPFKDVEGLIEERPKPDRLILQIDALGRAASLEIDASLLQPVT